MLRIIQFLAAVIWLWFLNVPHGSLPAFGPLFDLHSGLWRHQDFKWQDLNLKGLEAKVRVAIDGSGIPHIFAENEHDLYLAQGYVLASHRLFQMDLSSRSVAGNLSELVGPKGLEIDRFFIKFGMRRSIRETEKRYEADPQTKAMLEDYVQGVNLFIAELEGHPEKMPPEYKLLAKKPRPFDLMGVAGMGKALTYSLNGRVSDSFQSHLVQMIGLKDTLDLFPEFLDRKFADYIFPRDWGGRLAPESEALFKFQTHIKDFPAIPQPHAGNGSNNWAVAPKKSTTGHSLLANDTHLGLTLPNIWFETQLSCPQFNVYGSALIDVPGIINGMTAKTAWGPTNGTTDALDEYEVRIDGANYVTKTGLKPLEATQEKLDHGDGTSETIEVPYTEYGPVFYREGTYGLVLVWTGREAGGEIKALRHLYDSKDLASCQRAFDDWRVPIQNFVCADPDHIGLKHTGFIPERANGEGRMIGDYAELNERPLSQPLKENPQAIDPPEGFVRSANERVVNETFPYYLGFDYEEPFRGYQIRKLLSAKSKLSPEDMIAIQNDDFNPLAEMALPNMLAFLDTPKLNDAQKQAVEKLKTWNLRMEAQRFEPTLFQTWFQGLKHKIFDPQLPESKRYSPQDIRIVEMLDRIKNNPQTTDVRFLKDPHATVTEAFLNTWNELLKRDPKPENWLWRDAIDTHLPHVAHLPGFGSKRLDFNGSAYSVRGNQGAHGAVYRFVVALSSEWPEAWMQIPGGPSGDPFAPDFESFVDDWAAGKMRKVAFFKNFEEAAAAGAKVYTYSPEAK